MKRVRIIIKGKVQGVLFRKFVKDNADKLSIRGYVENKEDYVEAVFEGEDMAVDRMVDLCRKGPDGAEVENVELFREGVKKEDSFYIKRA